MSALNATMPTLLDLTKRLDPDGKIAMISEILAQDNEVLADIPWIEGNLATGHKTTVRTGYPEATFRKLNYGVPNTKSTTASVTDSCGMLEDYAEVDKELADLNGNTAAFRLSEDRAHIEGMSQKLAKYIFYGNEGSEPEAFTGLAPRFNSLSAENAENIIDAGGSGSDNASIWLCCWGDKSGHGIYPKGSKAGLQSQDLGEQTLFDATGNKFQGYRSHYQWKCGLSIRDWQYFARIANIDVSNLNTLANTKDLITWMVMASERVRSFSGVRACWYVNRTIREKLRLGITEKIANNLSWETVAGKRVMVFDDIPVRRVDQLLNTESRVV